MYNGKPKMVFEVSKRIRVEKNNKKEKDKKREEMKIQNTMCVLLLTDSKFIQITWNK